MNDKIVKGILKKAKKFELKAHFELDKRTLSIPHTITLPQMARYAKVRRPKKWLNNRRYNRKFCKFYYRYLPKWALDFWRELPIYQKATNEIMYEEDKRLIEEMNKSIGM